MKYIAITVLIPVMTPGRWVLLYSPSDNERAGHNHALTNDGDEVEYTGMHDEQKYGKWQKSYKWTDARVVGYVNGYDQITKIHKCEHDGNKEWYWRGFYCRQK